MVVGCRTRADMVNDRALQVGTSTLCHEIMRGTSDHHPQLKITLDEDSNLDTSHLVPRITSISRTRTLLLSSDGSNGQLAVAVKERMHSLACSPLCDPFCGMLQSAAISVTGHNRESLRMWKAPIRWFASVVCRPTYPCICCW